LGESFGNWNLILQLTNLFYTLVFFVHLLTSNLFHLFFSFLVLNTTNSLHSMLHYTYSDSLL
jgi:hypothetical protein